MTQASDTEDLKKVSRLFTEGKYAEAGELSAVITARSPDNSRAFYLYGLCCYQTGDKVKAAEQFRRAVALNPQDFDSLFNLGVTSGELRRYTEAIDIYRSLLEKAPQYTKALPNLAQALIRTGRYEEGIAAFRQAPKDVRTAALMLEYQCMFLPMRERAAVCNETLAFAGLPDHERYTALLYRANAEWVLQDDAALEASLAAASAIKPQPDNKNFISMSIYKNFLTHLLEYRKANPALYSGSGEPLFLVGDSHSLSYAGTAVRLEGTDYKIESQLIVGIKAWHIATQEPNERREALAHYIARLPEGSRLLCAFGEIDCRNDSGILPYWKKTGGSLESTVGNLVKGYVVGITAMASKRKLQPMFLSVPAPHPMSGDRREVIALFNSALLKEAGHRFIDLYKRTLGSGGYADAKYYIDSYHLKPDMLGQASH